MSLPSFDTHLSSFNELDWLHIFPREPAPLETVALPLETSELDLSLISEDREFFEAISLPENAADIACLSTTSKRIDELWQKMGLGRKIKQLRCRLGLTREDFGDSVGKCLKVVEDWERGISKPKESAKKIGKVLQFDFVNFIATQQYKDEVGPKELRKRLVGETIRTYRRTQQMSQKDLAQKIGVKTEVVGRWENGFALRDMTHKEKLDEIFDTNIFCRSGDIQLDKFEKHLSSGSR